MPLDLGEPRGLAAFMGTRSWEHQTSVCFGPKYYVAWDEYGVGNPKCVKNCVAEASFPECGGLATDWQEKYKTADICCSEKLSWMDRKDCTLN